MRESPGNFPDWEALKSLRIQVDEMIVSWADGMAPDWPQGELAWYSGAIKSDVRRPRWLTVAHFFNHQTHHRGQVHAMLTAAGAKPEETDLFLMP